MTLGIFVNQQVYKWEGSVCVVAVVCTLCSCERVSISEHTNGDYSSAEHCLILWRDYKNKWCQVYDSSVSVSCNRQLVTQWSFVQHCSLHYSILDNDWDYNTSIRNDYSDNHNHIGDAGCAALSKCLQECRELQTLLWVWTRAYRAAEGALGMK